MAQACLKCLKYTMCAANLLCFLCGTAVLGMGIYLMVNFKMAALTPSLANLNLANMLLITGIIITCVSFLGFLGALKENRCLLLTFFLLLFILMLVELAAACLLLLYETEIAKWVKTDLEKGLKEAKGNVENTTTTTTTTTTTATTTILNDWDVVQKKLKCCGVVNASDWGDNVPRSCCIDTCDPQTRNYYATGCYETLRVFFEDNFLYTGIAVIVLCVVEVLGMCFAMTLFCHISRTGLGYKL